MRSSEAAMSRGGGAQRPVWGGNELKKTGARSARARTRGKNPLVQNILKEISVWLSEKSNYPMRSDQFTGNL
jgi:hypothetical protein